MTIKLTSSSTASPNGGALSWMIEQDAAGRATLTVTLNTAIPDCQAPHVRSIVLAQPPVQPLDEPWELVDHLRLDAPNDDMAEFRAVHLRPPIENLKVGQTRTWTLPVGIDQVLALVFGSLTDRVWVETERHHLWLVHLEPQGLLGWINHIGTNPLIDRSNLIVAPDGILLQPIDQVRLSETHPDPPQRTPVTGPRYVAVADDLRSVIESGLLQPGDQLPSIGDLAEQYGVSTAVTRQALELLRKQALITTQSGHRPVVRDLTTRTRYSNATHWEMRERISLPTDARQEHDAQQKAAAGLVDRPAQFDRVDSDPVVTPEWPTGTPLLRREFLSCDQAGHWLIRSVSYLPISVIESNPRLLDPAEEPWPGGIHHQLSTVGVLLGRIEHQVTARTPTSVESYTWGLPIGEPLLRLTETGWSEDDLDGPPVWVNHITQPGLTAELEFIDYRPRTESRD